MAALSISSESPSVGNRGIGGEPSVSSGFAFFVLFLGNGGSVGKSILFAGGKVWRGREAVAGASVPSTSDSSSEEVVRLIKGLKGTGVGINSDNFSGLSVKFRFFCWPCLKRSRSRPKLDNGILNGDLVPFRWGESGPAVLSSPLSSSSLASLGLLCASFAELAPFTLGFLSKEPALGASVEASSSSPPSSASTGGFGVG